MPHQPFAICRTEKIKSWATLAKSVGHNLRTSADDRQHLADVPEPLKILAGEAGWIEGWQADVNGMHLRKLAMGQSHTLAREFFLGMSPEWAEGKKPAEIDAWAEANIAWLNKRFGKDRVKLAVLHLDEQTPHIAAYVVPLKADAKARGNGWTLSDNALGLGGNKAALAQLQDEYAEAMKGFELRRGVKGSKASHETTAAWRHRVSAPLDHPVTWPKPPNPTLADRLDPKPYAEAAAKAAAGAVFKQMKPYRDQAARLAKDQKKDREKLDRLEALVQELRPLSEMFRALMEAIAGHPIALNTIEGQRQAMKSAKGLLAMLRPTEPEIAPAPIPAPMPEAPAIDGGKRVASSVRSPNRKPRAPRPGHGAGLSR